MKIVDVALALEEMEVLTSLEETQDRMFDLYKAFVASIAHSQVDGVDAIPVKLRIQAELCLSALTIVDEKRPRLRATTIAQG